jgi:hypothetical protein
MNADDEDPMKTSRKIVNDPLKCADELLEGLVEAYDGQARKVGERSIVMITLPEAVARWSAAVRTRAHLPWPGREKPRGRRAATSSRRLRQTSPLGHSGRPPRQGVLPTAIILGDVLNFNMAAELAAERRGGDAQC